MPIIPNDILRFAWDKRAFSETKQKEIDVDDSQGWTPMGFAREGEMKVWITSEAQCEPVSRREFTIRIPDEPIRDTVLLKDLLPPHRLSLIIKTPLLVSLGAYLSGAPFSSALGWTALLTSILCATLYALNEATDFALEQSREVDARHFFGLLLLPWILSLAASRWSPQLPLYMSAMIAGQFAYSLTPFRLKRRWWGILVFGGVLNPILRMRCGAIGGMHAISPSAYLIVVALHMSAVMRSKLSNRDRDRRFGYDIAPLQADTAGKCLTLFGLIVAIPLCLTGILPVSMLLLVGFGTLFSLVAWSDLITARIDSLEKRRLLAYLCIAALFFLFQVHY